MDEVNVNVSSQGKFERNICQKIAQKLGGKDYVSKEAYTPQYFKGELTNDLIRRILLLNRDYSSILTSMPVKAGNRRAVEHTLGIFEMNKQLGYESGEDINKVITLCVAQVLELLPRAVCKAVDDSKIDNLEYYGYTIVPESPILQLDHKFSVKEE